MTLYLQLIENSVEVKDAASSLTAKGDAGVSRPLSSKQPVPKPTAPPGSDSDEPGPSLPPRRQVEDEDEEKDEDEEPEFDPSDPEFDDEDSQLPQFPTTHEIVMKDHTKVISALALDPSGARVLSGSHDYDCKLWDFGGMDYRCKPFKTWEPSGTYHVGVHSSFMRLTLTHIHLEIHDVKYSIDGQRFLVVSGTTQAKLYDRDGEEECVW